MAISYEEKIDIQSASRFGFSPQGGRGVMQFVVDRADLTVDLITDLLGKVSDETDNGRLRRTRPRAHPQWPWLFCESITDCMGVGAPERAAATTEDIEAPAIDFYANYPKWLVTTSWAPRPYAVLSDATIDTGTVTWYDDDNEERSSPYAKEWLRWTSYTVHPRSEFLTATVGAGGCFRLSDSTTPSADGPGAPHLIPFAGHPRIPFPNATYRVKWHNVPLRYVESSNSHILRGLGRINQNDWWGFPKGSVLYENVEVSEPFVPAVPGLSVIGGEADNSAFKLVDVVFHLAYTERARSGGVPTIANRNWIPFGWNLSPWVRTRKYYYTTMKAQPGQPDANTGWLPNFLSFPMELLFSDPDYAP